MNETSNSELKSIRFTGKTGEYFKIWIVNIFLTLITLGIYSAWAKVRSNRYFYANTYLNGSAFEYTADPLKILKGRVIVVGFYILFLLSSQVMLNPIVSLVILLFALFITPWIITKAVKFKLKNTKYKNINFHYHGTSKDMYKFFLLHVLLNLITVGLAYPYSYNSFKKLLINKSSYGDTFFHYEGKSKDIYINFLKLVIIYFLAVFLSAFLIGTLSSLLIPIIKNQPESHSISGGISIFFIFTMNFIYIFIFFALKAFYDAIMQNYIYSHTKLDTYPLKSSWSSVKLCCIYLVNILAIIFSLGLLYPWTKIRTLKYKLENIEVGIDEEFITKAVQSNDESAIGEETEDFFDMDIGL